MPEHDAPKGMGGIYHIIHIESGKRYIGRTGDFAKRWDAHQRDLNADKHHSQYLQHAWNRYGADAFVFTVIEYVADPCERIEHEQYHLDKRRFEKGTREYNVSDSAVGPVGVKHTAQSRINMSAAHRGKSWTEAAKAKRRLNNLSRIPTWIELAAREELKERNRQRLTGISPTQEVRDKIRATLEGRPPSPKAHAANTARRGRPLNARQVAANTARRGRPLTEKEQAYHDSQKGIINENLQANAWMGRQLGAKASADKRRGKPASENQRKGALSATLARQQKHRTQIFDAMNKLGWGTTLPVGLSHFAVSKQIAAIHEMNAISVFRSLNYMLDEGLITRESPTPPAAPPFVPPSGLAQGILWGEESPHE